MFVRSLSGSIKIESKFSFPKLDSKVAAKPSSIL